MNLKILSENVDELKRVASEVKTEYENHNNDSVYNPAS